MYLRRLFFILFVTLNLYSYAQQTKDLMGYWVYESVIHANNRDSLKSKLVENLYNDLYIHFKKNGHYTSQILNRNEYGHWTYKNSKLELRSKQGALIEFKIIELKPLTLTVQFANETFLLKRRDNYILTVAKENEVPPKIKKKKKKKRKKD